MSLGAENTLEAVRAVYSGAEGELWELLMGQQIHIGGIQGLRGFGRTSANRGRAAGGGPMLL